MNHLFLFSFLGVYLKAFQQRNVAFNNWVAIPIFSFGMVASEVIVVLGVVDYGLSLSTVLNMGLGGTLGCWAAMYSHKRIFG
jgi:hypothetical protein